MNSYLLLKSLHIFGVVLFLGNAIVTGWWKSMADRTRQSAVIAFVQCQVALTDWIFTTAGALLVVATGIGNAWLHDLDCRSVYWMSWGMWFFGLSGVLWVAC